MSECDSDHVTRPRSTLSTVWEVYASVRNVFVKLSQTLLWRRIGGDDERPVELVSASGEEGGRVILAFVDIDGRAELEGGIGYPLAAQAHSLGSSLSVSRVSQQGRKKLRVSLCLRVRAPARHASRLSASAARGRR